MEQLEDIFAGLTFASALVLIVYFIARYTFLIKKMLADKGILEPRPESRITKLDIAYLGLGIGVGLLLSAGLSTFAIEEKTLNLLVWAIVLLCGSGGLLMAAKQKK